MMPVSSHGPVPQEPIIVEIEGIGELEFPGDTDPSVIQAKVRELTTPKRPEQIGAEHDPNYLADDPDLGKRVSDNLPTVGALAAGLASGGAGLIPAAIAAGGGGFLGARLRGDSREDASFEGVKQGAMQLGGGLVVKGGARLANMFMRGGIPKGIQAEFGGRRVAQEALDTGAIPGSEASAKRITGLSAAANQGMHTAAQQVPTMGPRKLVGGFRKLFDESVSAKTPDRTREIVATARKSGKEVRGGLDGKGQIARKIIKAQEGKAAVNAENSKTVGLQSQLANAERDALASHLRETPGMEDALDLAQRRMGLDRFMQDSLTSNMVNRMGGGPINMLRSPMGLGVTAHTVNQGRRVADPTTLRLLDMLMRAGSHE